MKLHKRMHRGLERRRAAGLLSKQGLSKPEGTYDSKQATEPGVAPAAAAPGGHTTLGACAHSGEPQGTGRGV
jgi:hypothetical protein